MRLLSIVLGVTLLAPIAGADVRLSTKKDGTKVIYNVDRGSTKSSKLDWLAKQHDRRSEYDEIIEKYAERYGIDATLVRAVIQVESNFNKKCVSSKGARGLMQLMPGTAERFGVGEDDIHDPEHNIRAGVQYLAYLLRLFNDDLSRALAGYNAGENAVLRHGGIPPYRETEAYVTRALTVYYGRPYGGGGSISFASRTGGRKLRGGFGTDSGALSTTTALIPGAKYLGTF